MIRVVRSSLALALVLAATTPSFAQRVFYLISPLEAVERVRPVAEPAAPSQVLCVCTSSDPNALEHLTGRLSIGQMHVRAFGPSEHVIRHLRIAGLSEQIRTKSLAMGRGTEGVVIRRLSFTHPLIADTESARIGDAFGILGTQLLDTPDVTAPLRLMLMVRPVQGEPLRNGLIVDDTAGVDERDTPDLFPVDAAFRLESVTEEISKAFRMYVHSDATEDLARSTEVGAPAGVAPVAAMSSTPSTHSNGGQTDLGVLVRPAEYHEASTITVTLTPGELARLERELQLRHGTHFSLDLKGNCVSVRVVPETGNADIEPLTIAADAHLRVEGRESLDYRFTPRGKEVVLLIVVTAHVTEKDGHVANYPVSVRLGPIKVKATWWDYVRVFLLTYWQYLLTLPFLGAGARLVVAAYQRQLRRPFPVGFRAA